MTTTVLRVVGIAVTCAAIVDPVWSVQRPDLLAVDIQTSEDDDARMRADVVRAHLASGMEGAVDVSGARPPRTVVFVGDRIERAVSPPDVPVSIVSSAASTPNVRITRVRDSGVVVLGQAATIEADLEAHGAAGQTSEISIDDRGVTVATAKHRWNTPQERHTLRLSYAPPSAGTRRVVLRARPLPAERRHDDNTADASIVVRDRKLRVLVHEPRPSWNAAFIRRVLESDGRFSVSALSQVSRAFSTRDESAPPALAAAPERLDDFDAIVAGAPEELRAADVDALARFARVRGGAVVLLPDRRPSGPYARLMGATRFSEMLLENPVRLTNDVAPDLRASEFIVTEGLSPGAATLVTVPSRGSDAPVASVTPMGDGVVVFWGAADAWRFRADAGEPFARFWRSVVADLASQAPEAIDVTLDPASVRPNTRFTIQVRLRATELRDENGRSVTPDVAARIVSPSGAAEDVRLWPAAEPGRFVGHAAAGAVGTYEVRVLAGERSTEAALHVTEEAMTARDSDFESLRIVAETTGGIVTTEADLEALDTHLRRIGTPLAAYALRPMRSGWWFVVLAACLCGEWAIRRTRGLP